MFRSLIDMLISFTQIFFKTQHNRGCKIDILTKVHKIISARFKLIELESLVV